MTLSVTPWGCEKVARLLDLPWEFAKVSMLLDLL